MAPRDADRSQLDFPQLVADIIGQLNLTGTLGVLEFSDQVTPVYIVAQRAGALEVTTQLPAFQSAEIVFGAAIDPAGGSVIVDTGALAAGTYDIQAQMAFNGNMAIAGQHFSLEHRNAANAVTLATLSSLVITGSFASGNMVLPLTGYEIALNERLRVLSPLAVISGGISGSIFTRLRPTP